MNTVLSPTHNLKRSLAYKGGLCVIFILGLSSIFSPIRVLPFFNQLWAVCIFFWVVCVLLDNPIYLLKPTKFRLVLYVYLIYTISLAYIAGNGLIGNRYFELSQLLLFYLAYEKNSLQGRNSDNLLILKWLFPFIILTNLITLYIYKTNPIVSRLLKTSQGLGIEYSKIGVGGYEFIYFLVIFVPILLFVFTRNHIKMDKKYRALGVVLIILFSINIILSNFSTAFFLLILGCGLCLFLKEIKSHRIPFYLMLSLIFYFISDFLAISLLDFILNNIDEKSVNFSRVLEVKEYLIAGSGGSSIDARNSAFIQSINVFIENPISGIIVEPLKVNSFGQVTGFGQHSHTLDTFALYGVLIGALQLYLYCRPIYSRLTIVKGSVNGFSLTILIIFLILTTINVATPSIGFAVFFIFPTVYEKYFENQIRHVKEKKIKHKYVQKQNTTNNRWYGFIW